MDITSWLSGCGSRGSRSNRRASSRAGEEDVDDPAGVPSVVAEEVLLDADGVEILMSEDIPVVVQNDDSSSQALSQSQSMSESSQSQSLSQLEATSSTASAPVLQLADDSLTLGKKRSKSASSDVWHFFRKSGKEAVYTICAKKYFRNNSATSQFKMHLVKKHPEEYAAFQRSGTSTQPKITAVIKGEEKYSNSSKRKRDIDEAIVQFVALDMRPLRVVDGRGFKNLLYILDPRYPGICRKRLSRDLLPIYFQECVKWMKAELKSVDHVALTTDMWSSMVTDSYFTVTAHFWKNGEKSISSICLCCKYFTGEHNGSNIRDGLVEVMKEFDIVDKVKCIATDNGSNIRRALTLMQSQCHIPCLGHTLALVCTDLTNSVTGLKELRDKVSKVVTLVRRSNKAKEAFNKLQKMIEPKKTPLALIQDVATRWNSTFNMFLRFHQLKAALLLFLAERDDLADFQAQEWSLMKSVCEVLGPIFMVTEQMSGESYPTGSMALPLTMSLMGKMCTLQTSTGRDPNAPEVLKEMLRIAIRSMNKRFNGWEGIMPLALSSLVDPRFKTMGFMDKEREKEAVHKCKELMLENLTQKEAGELVDADEPQAEPEEEDRNVLDRDMAWDYFESVVSSKRTRVAVDTVAERVDKEFLRYMRAPLRPRKDDPIKWWIAEGRMDFPNLYLVALEFLIVPATSVPSERVFSTAGGVINKHRTRLQKSTANKLIVLKQNKFLKVKEALIDDDDDEDSDSDDESEVEFCI